MPNVEWNGCASHGAQRRRRPWRSERRRQRECGRGEHRRERLRRVFRVRRCDVRQVFERGARRVFVVRAGRTVRAVPAIAVDRRRLAMVSSIGSVGFVAMLRVRDGMNWLMRRVIVLRDDARFVGRSRGGHRARRNAGREIGDGKRRDDIARRPALPASQPRENVRSIVHGYDSMFITVGADAISNKWR